MNRTQKIVLVAGLILFAILPQFLKSYGIYLMTLLCVYLMAAFGLNLIVGYAGQMSIGQAAFYGIGAYIAAILMTRLGISFWLALPIAAVVCFVVGLALGFPALRVQHHYLAFATLGFKRPRIPGHAQRGSADRRNFRHFEHSASVPLRLLARWQPAVLLFRPDLGHRARAALWWLLRSPWGRAFAALRDNPIRAESTGVNITAYTLLAFAIGAACAGIGGVYLAALVNFIEPGQFHLSVSLMMLLAVIVGGSGRFFGPVLGSIVVVLLPEWLRFLQDWYLAIFGFAVIVLMVYLPAGCCRSATGSSRRKRDDALPRSQGHEEGVRRHQGRRRRFRYPSAPVRSSV